LGSVNHCGADRSRAQVHCAVQHANAVTEQAADRAARRAMHCLMLIFGM
jgi:hypothetical protein